MCSDAVTDDVRIARDAEGDFDSSDGEPRVARSPKLPVFLPDVVGINFCLVGIRFKERADGVMRRDLFAGHNGRLDKFFVNDAAILIFWKIAFGLLQNFEETGFKVFRAEFARQLQGARGVLNDLRGLDAGNFVEEPAATREHQHCVPLHFEQAERGDLIRFAQFTRGVFAEKP